MNEENINNEHGLKNKKISKKKLILIIIGTLIVLIGIILAVILFKRDDSDESETIKEISNKLYQEYVDDYGRRFTSIAQNYYNYYNVYPTFDDIKDEFNETHISKDVKCEENTITSNGEIIIKKCKVKKYKYNKNIEYSGKLYKSRVINNNTNNNNEENDEKEKINEILLNKLNAKYLNKDLVHLDTMNRLPETTTNREKIFKNNDLLKYTLINGELKIYIMDTEKYISYKDVKKAYVNEMGCSGDHVFIIFTKDKIIKFDLSETHIVVDNSIEENDKVIIENASKYKDIYQANIASSTCDAVFDYILLGNDNKYYDIKNGKEYNLNKIVRIDFSKNDKPSMDDINKAKMIINDIEGNPLYIIDENNYLYYLNEDNIIVKASNLEVEKVIENEKDNYASIYFKDGSIYKSKNVPDGEIPYCELNY